MKLLRRIPRRIRHLLEAALVLPLVALFFFIPRPLAHYLGRSAGKFAFQRYGRARKVALENLRVVLGVEGDRARRIARESFAYAGSSFIDLIRAPRMTRLVARRQLDIPKDVQRKLDAVRDSGRGAVYGCSHLGNWEFLNLVAPYSSGARATVIVRPIANPILNRLLRFSRSRTGQRIIYRAGAAMDCMERVRNGEVCGITFDLPVPPEAGAAAIPFFGLDAYTTLGLGYIAALAHAPVYLIYCLRTRAHLYRLYLDGPFEVPEDAKTLHAAAVQTTALISRHLESVVRKHPEAWGWWLKRWRIRPDETTKPYPSYSLPVSRFTSKKRDH